MIHEGMKALVKAYDIHQELGASGKDVVRKNRFGDSALRADIEMENAVINHFKEIKSPIRVISEEHGVVDIGKPENLAVLDGLDGSVEYKKKENGRYGTMLGIFSNLNPNYDDYLFCGIMEHSTGKLYYGYRSGGSWVCKNFELPPKEIRCSGYKKLDEKTRIQADKNCDEALKMNVIHDAFLSKMEGFDIAYPLSSAASFADLASGKTDLVLQCTRKNNLELAVAYGLIKEAEGVIVTTDETDMGKESYLEFGQNDHIPVIAASTKQLAMKLIKHIS